MTRHQTLTLELPYFSNELENRNLVALPNRVWVTDLFNPKVTLGTSYDLRVLIVIDLGTRELLLCKGFAVINGGNVRSKYIVREFRKLLSLRDIHEQLLIHSDRGSEYTSAEYRLLFQENAHLIPSMSASNTPTDNSVAERFVRTLKSQLPSAGVWPKAFRSTVDANKFLESRCRYINEHHVSRTGEGLPSGHLYHALQSNKEAAPANIAHWAHPAEYSDIHSDAISSFKRNSAQSWNNRTWSPEASLRRAEIFSSMAARGASIQQGVNADVLERLNDLQLAVGDLAAKLENSKAQSRKKRTELPLRDRASGDVCSYLLSLPRRTNESLFVWSRNRIAIVLLRWIGGRASDVSHISLKQLRQAIDSAQFQFIQPKTKKARIVVLPQRALLDLKALSFDIERVFRLDDTKPLGSSARSNKVLRNEQWIRTLNNFIKQAVPQFKLVLSSHSFRVNYITSLLRSVPLERVSQLIGHSDVRTTCRYNRYVVDATLLKVELEKLD
jgi:transposase InsO family protein/site-specific recombinase XerD